MGDLARWLGEQLNTDTARATAARGHGEGRWRTDTGGYNTGRVEDERGETVVYDEGAPLPEEAAHIAEWDPARVLAEISAKRQLVQLLAETIEARENYKGPDFYEGVAACERALKLLALPYVDRPGYAAAIAAAD